MNIALVTRGDIFPPFHGAAAKIVSTARNLSLIDNRVFIVSENRLRYHEFLDGRLIHHSYPQWLRHALHFPQMVKFILMRVVGVPDVDCLLYQALFDLNFWLRVLYIALSRRIDVLEAEFPGYVLPCLIARLVRRCHTCLVQHNVEYLRIADSSELTERAQRNLKWIERFLCIHVGQIITVSEKDRRDLIEIGIPPDKIQTIPHGVDLGSYARISPGEIRERYGIDPDEILLFFHGILSYQPNREAARAIAEIILPALGRMGYRVKAIIAGRFPPREISHPDLIYTGAIGDLQQHIKAADIAVVPLLGGGGIRMKILEYFAAEVPVVATAKGAEGIETGPQEGMVVVDDMDRFIEALVDLIEDKAKRRQIGKKGYLFVSDLDWITLCLHYIDLFRKSPVCAATHRQRPVPSPWSEITTGDHSLGPGTAVLSLTAPPVQTSTVRLSQPRLMPRALALRILDQCRDYGVKRIVLTGKGSLGHPHIHEILERIDYLDMTLSVQADGDWDRDAAASLGRLRQLVCLFPLGRPGPDGYLNARDNRSVFMGLMRKCLRVRSALPRGHIVIRIHLVHSTMKEIFGLYKMSRRLGAHLHIEAVSIDAEDEHLDRFDREIYLSFLDFVSRSGSIDQDQLRYLEAIIHYYDGSLSTSPCPALSESFFVEAWGNLHPCPMTGDQEPLGDLLNEPLVEVIEREMTNEVRSKLVNERDLPYPTCHACIHRRLHPPMQLRWL